MGRVFSAAAECARCQEGKHQCSLQLADLNERPMSLVEVGEAVNE